MANDVVKVGISPDGKTINYKDLDASIVVSSAGETVESHMTNKVKHVPATSSSNNGRVLTTLSDGSTGWTYPTSAYTKTEVDTKDSATLASAKTYTDQKINELVNGAPGTLDTLKEIADELSNNKTTVDAVNSAIGNKQDKITATGMLKRDATGNIVAATLGTDYVVPTGNVATSDKLKTAKAFSITGGATAAAVNFDGSGNVALNVTALDATKLTGSLPDTSVKKQVCFVTTEAEIATQNLMAGGLVLMKVR